MTIILIVTVITLCIYLFKLVNYLFIHLHLLDSGALQQGFGGRLSGLLRHLAPVYPAKTGKKETKTPKSSTPEWTDCLEKCLGVVCIIV